MVIKYHFFSYRSFNKLKIQYQCHSRSTTIDGNEQKISLYATTLFIKGLLDYAIL